MGTLKAFGASPAKPKPKLKSFGSKPKKLRSFGTKASDPRKRALEAAQSYAISASKRHNEATKLELKLFKTVDKLEHKRGGDSFDAAYKAWNDSSKEAERTYVALHQAIVREQTVLREIETR